MTPSKPNPQETIAIAGFVVVFLAFAVWMRFELTPLEAFWALVSP